jgi:hypothetical protein
MPRDQREPAIAPIRFDVSVWNRRQCAWMHFARLSERDERKLRADHPDWTIRSAPFDQVDLPNSFV